MRILTLLLFFAIVSCDKSHEGGPLRPLPPEGTPSLPDTTTTPTDTIPASPVDTLPTSPVDTPQVSYYFYSEINGNIIDYKYPMTDYPENAPIFHMQGGNCNIYGGTSGCLADPTKFCYNLTVSLPDSSKGEYEPLIFGLNRVTLPEEDAAVADYNPADKRGASILVTITGTQRSANRESITGTFQGTIAERHPDSLAWRVVPISGRFWVPMKE